MLQHTQAVLARIREIPALASKTYAAVVPKDAQGAIPSRPFVIVYPADGIDDTDRLAAPRTRQHPRFTLHVVGSSYENVATVAGLVKAKFIVNDFDVPPAVSGEVTSNLTWESPIPVQIDTDVVPSVPYQVIELAFDAEPA